MDSTSALPHSPGSRSVGIGLVVGLHVLAIVAISSGLHYVRAPVKPDLQVRIEKAPERPLPPPVRHINVVQPQLTQPEITRVIPPDLTIAPPPVTQAAVIDTAPPRAETGGLPISVAPGVKPANAIQSVGVACTKTQTPELPALDWSGEALFRVVASTEAGRVTQVEIQALRGGMDYRTQRQVKTAIERALRDGYVCPGNVRFTQEFDFKVD